MEDHTGGQSAYSIAYRPRANTRFLIAHDSHTLPGQANLKQWLKVNGRVRGLLDIGYHYVIFEDGELLACRPHNVQGSHCRGFDAESIGVCLQGGLRLRPGQDGEEPFKVHCDTFTEAQKDKLAGLHYYLEHHYPGIKLKAHSEMGHHARALGYLCPALDIEDIRTRCSHQQQALS